MIVSGGKIQGYANKFTETETVYRSYSYSTKEWSGGDHEDKENHVHKPDAGCNDWMLCKGIPAVTYVNLFSQIFKNV